MIASEQFKMRISPKEKAMLADVAKHFQRSKADTLKAFIRETYQLVKAEKSALRNTNPKQPPPA